MPERTETFNRGHLDRHSRSCDPITQDEIRSTPGLLNASLKDAVMYGGRAVQAALSSAPLLYARDNVIVDVKVHMLMPGMVPAIPGWHTDGVPRCESGSPSGPLAPDLRRQEGVLSPIYHLFYAGCDAPTVFLNERDVELDVPADPSADLYSRITKEVTARDTLERVELPDLSWWTWDWWELHSAQPSRDRGWRMLIRITESDFIEASSDLRDVIRMQQQAYVQDAFGW